METDTSLILYQKYFSLANRQIEVKLKNNRTISGVIVGFFKSDEDAHDFHICEWHIADEKDKLTLGVDAFGYIKGVIVRHRDIIEVKFFEDGSIMKMNAPV